MGRRSLLHVTYKEVAPALTEINASAHPSRGEAPQGGTRKAMQLRAILATNSYRGSPGAVLGAAQGI